jgi:hypothetical protein
MTLDENWRHAPKAYNGNYVCSRHFSDKNLKNYIINKAMPGICSYCERKKNVIKIKDFASYVEEMISFEYDDPYNRGAIYNKHANYYEDRFPGLYVAGSMELLQDLIEVDCFEIIEDLSDQFGNSFWSEIDSVFGPTKDKYLKVGWQEFKNILKHKVRFLFFAEALKDDFKGDEYEEYINPVLILKEVHKAINDLGLFKIYPKQKLRVFRARQHESALVYNSSEDLGSPPPHKAKANRMSPAGISMFYGAFDTETCRREIIDEEKKDTVMTIGSFSNLKDLKLIDFTKLKQIPSLFDERFRTKRSTAKFLKDFIEDLSIPVIPDERVHVDYIPTQVVTEYFKIIMGRESNLDGIIYNSVKNPGGKCVVLFVENKDCCDKYEIVDPSNQIISNFLGLPDVSNFDKKQIATLILDNKKIILETL